MKRKSIGLVLGGGGAKGSYQIGVVKALEEYGLMKDVTVVSGTSIGAINALLIMSKDSHEELIEAWKYLDNAHVYADGRTRYKKDKKGLYQTNTIYSTLKKQAPLDRIKNSKIQGFAVAARLKHDGELLSQIRKSKMEKKVFNLNMFHVPHRAVQASVSIPILFGATKLYGSYYVDGGMLDNHPVQPVIDYGCNVVLNIPLDRFFDESSYQKQNVFIIDFGSKKNFHRSRVIDLIDAVRFETARINERFEYGYLVGKQVIENLKEAGYFDADYGIRKPRGYKRIGLTKEQDDAIYKKVRDMLQKEKKNDRTRSKD